MALGKEVFAECQGVDTRQRCLRRHFFYRVRFAECRTRQTLCRVQKGLCRVYSTLGKQGQSGSVSGSMHDRPRRRKSQNKRPRRRRGLLCLCMGFINTMGLCNRRRDRGRPMGQVQQIIFSASLLTMRPKITWPSRERTCI